MDQDDKATEKEITGSNADQAPRVRIEQINALADSLVLHTHHFPGTTLTVAAAVLPDGFVVALGQSACISPANFNAELGAKIAKEDATAAARKKLWELEGYLLRNKLEAAAG